MAAQEHRVVLTCDRHFVRARYSDHTFFVRSERKSEQLDEVRERWFISIRALNIICSCRHPVNMCNKEVIANMASNTQRQ